MICNKRRWWIALTKSIGEACFTVDSCWPVLLNMRSSSMARHLDSFSSYFFSFRLCFNSFVFFVQRSLPSFEDPSLPLHITHHPLLCLRIYHLKETFDGSFTNSYVLGGLQSTCCHYVNRWSVFNDHSTPMSTVLEIENFWRWIFIRSLPPPRPWS